VNETLSKAPMLDELGEAGRELLEEFLEERSYADGFLLFQQNEEASELLVVSRGRVGLRKGGEVIASLGAGDCLGGVSLVVIGTRECEAFADLDLLEGIVRHVSLALRDALGELSR